MKKLFGQRPSPAMIVAIVAVILAVGGTATAALTKKDKKQVKNIANKQIDAKAPGLSVANAANSANAAAVGGVPASGLQQGGGHTYYGAVTGNNPSNNNLLLSIPGIAEIRFDCAANGIDSTLEITNTSGSFLVDVGQNQDSNSADLDPFGPNITNGATKSISHTGAGNTVANTTLMLFNDGNDKVASIQISNVFCAYGAWASTNQ